MKRGRRTTTGRVLEEMALPALRHGGYKFEEGKIIGQRLGGGKHKIDLLVSENGKLILVSMKWQQVSGTAEQKIPFEIMCLAEVLLQSDKFDGAYLVLGGNGWKLKEFYIGGGLRGHLIHHDLVRVVSLDTFVSLANSGLL